MVSIVKDPSLKDLVTFVPNKKIPVYNWFYYKEGFSRDFVMLYLERWRPKRLYDPFAGSGTSLLAAKEYGIESIGIDVNPVALLASEVKTRNWDAGKLRDLLEGLKDERFVKIKERFPFARFFPKPAVEDLVFLRRKIMELPLPERKFFLLVLMNAANKCSWLYKDGAVLKVRKKPTPPLRKYFFRLAKRMIKESQRIKGPEPLVMEGDARTMTFEGIDAVITSPPYLNKIEYQKIYSVEEWILGLKDRPGIRSYISGGEVVEQYFKDIRQVLERIHESMVEGGRVAWVVAGGVFPDRVVEADVMTAEIAEQTGFGVERIVEARTRVATRNRTIKIGSARESVVEMTKL